MTFTPELIGALFNGAVLLLGGLGLTAAQRSRRTAVGRREFRALQRENLAWSAWCFRLEQELSERGIPVPARPAILEIEDDDGSTAPAAGGG